MILRIYAKYLTHIAAKLKKSSKIFANIKYNTHLCNTKGCVFSERWKIHLFVI